ncbi:MAG: WG repeat-containing protein [Flavobacteriaceae bacterium]|jgi:hypothetical protein|nr:WG repeat-containing protein [Flavobacteriaceae bacterium]
MKFLKILVLVFVSGHLQAQLPKLIPYQCSDRKWGYSDSLRNVVIPCQYHRADSFADGYAFVYSSDCKEQYTKTDDIILWCKTGMIDENGNTIIPIEYESIGKFNEAGIARAVRGGKTGYIDKSGKEILPCIYTFVGRFNENLIKISLDKKYGLVDDNGVVVVPVQYDIIGSDANYYSQNNYIIAQKNGKYTLLDKTNGKEILPCIYDGIGLDSGDNRKYPYFKLRINENYGIADINGNIIIPVEYNYIHFHADFFKSKQENKNYYFTLEINRKRGIADINGNIIIPAEYSDVQPQQDIFQAKRGNKNFLYDKKGNKIAENYEQVEILKSDLLKVFQNGKWGVRNYADVEILPCRFDNIVYQINVDKIAAEKNGKSGLFTNQGEEIFPFVYDPIKDYYSDYRVTAKHLLVVSQNGKKGMINTKLRKEVIPCEYESIEALRSGTNLYKTRLRSSGAGYYVYGLMDDNGKMIFPCEYDDIYPMSGSPNVVRVEKNDKQGFIAADSGKWIIPMEYQKYSWQRKNLFFLKLNDKYGLVDSATAKPLSDFKYDEILGTNDYYYDKQNFIQVRIGSKFGLISKKGKEIAPCIYDKIESVNHTFFIQENQKWSAIDNKTGKRGKSLYTGFKRFERGGWTKWIITEDNDKKGLMTEDGEEIIKPQFQNIVKVYDDSALYGGLFIVASQSEKQGLINFKGNRIIPFQYDNIEVINKNLIAVNTDGLWGIIDFQKKQIIPCEYGNMEIFGLNLNTGNYYNKTKSELVKVRKNGKWGLLSKDGKQQFIPCEYGAVEILSEKLYVACHPDADIFFNNKGEKIASIYHNGNNDVSCNWYFGQSSIVTDDGIVDMDGNISPSPKLPPRPRQIHYGPK